MYLANKAEVIYRLLPTSGRASSSNSGWHLGRLFRSHYSRNLDDIFLSRVYRCMPQTVAHDSPHLIRGRNNFIPRAVCLVGASSADAMAVCVFRYTYNVYTAREIRRNLGYLSYGLNNFITRLIYSLNVSRAYISTCSTQRNMSSCTKAVAFISHDEDCVDILVENHIFSYYFLIRINYGLRICLWFLNLSMLW